MKLLLLGATGFVGSNVLPDLLSAGVDVVAVSRQPADQPAAAGLQWMSLDELLVRPSLDVDMVASFAGVGNPTVFETAPQTWAAAELQITDTIATLARLHRARNVVYLSTAGAAYGEGWRDGQGHAFRETDPCHPVSVYGQSKLAAEYRLAGLLAAPASDVSFTVLRASNIYGLRYAKGGQQGLVNALVERARLRLPITVFGDGLIYRDYLFSGDLSTALLALLLRPASGLFNIAFGRSHSILDVIAAVEAVMAIRFERLNAPARGFDVKYSGLSIENAKASLGWMPAVGLEQGIARIAAIGAA